MYIYVGVCEEFVLYCTVLCFVCTRLFVLQQGQRVGIILISFCLSVVIGEGHSEAPSL